MKDTKEKAAPAALVLRSGDHSVKSIHEDFDLFPQNLFSNLTVEEQVNVQDLILGSTVQEEDIDLSGCET